MTILGVPNIGVLKPVHVNIETVVGIHVHVGDKNTRLALFLWHRPLNALGAVFYSEH